MDMLGIWVISIGGWGTSDPASDRWPSELPSTWVKRCVCCWQVSWKGVTLHYIGTLMMNRQRVLVNATRSFELQNLNFFPAGARYQERILAGSKWLGKLLWVIHASDGMFFHFKNKAFRVYYCPFLSAELRNNFLHKPQEQVLPTLCCIAMLIKDYCVFKNIVVLFDLSAVSEKKNHLYQASFTRVCFFLLLLQVVYSHNIHFFNQLFEWFDTWQKLNQAGFF